MSSSKFSIHYVTHLHLPHVSDFKPYHQELRMTKPGGYTPDQKPNMLEPLKLQERVRCKPDKVKS
jgi:hypothetical protein